MDSPLEPFLTVFTPTPGMTMGEIEAEVQRLMVRNTAIDQALRGEIPFTDLFELLADLDCDPYEWVEVSLENCAAALQYG